jgi:hypothetical protein
MAHEPRPPITLEEFSRALAVHAMIVACPNELHSFFAPEQGEKLAQFIYRFAKGEPIGRPQAPEDRAD